MIPIEIARPTPGGRLLARVLETAREAALLKARGRQRTDSTHVLAAIRTLNRLELVGETLRAVQNAIAAAAPGWLRAVVLADWHERYDRRVENARLPESTAKREAYAVQVGADGYLLQDALDRPGTPAELPTLPAVAVLRRVWAKHYERAGTGGGDAGGGGAPLAGEVAALPRLLRVRAQRPSPRQSPPRRARRSSGDVMCRRHPGSQ